METETPPAADGRILAAELAATQYTSPMVVGNVVYFVDAPTVAFQLPETAGETVRLEKLWENDDLEGEFFASPICHEGVLHCASNEGMLYALDAKTGEILIEHEPEIGSASGKPGAEPANVYPSLALVGRHLLLANDAGETLVPVPGTQYKQIAHNYLDKGSGASAAPDGDCLLLRGDRDLYCIGSPQASRPVVAESPRNVPLSTCVHKGPRGRQVGPSPACRRGASR